MADTRRLSSSCIVQLPELRSANADRLYGLGLPSIVRPPAPRLAVKGQRQSWASLRSSQKFEKFLDPPLQTTNNKSTIIQDYQDYQYHYSFTSE